MNIDSILWNYSPFFLKIRLIMYPIITKHTITSANKMINTDAPKPKVTAVAINNIANVINNIVNRIIIVLSTKYIVP